MIKQIHNIIILFSVVLFMNCSGNSSNNEDPQLRVFNAGEHQIQIQLNSDIQKPNNFKVKPFNSSSSVGVSPSIYLLEISSGTKKLLKRKLTLAKNEKYSLVFYGRADLQDTVNQANFSYKMHRIFEGEENYTKNGYLPGYKVFQDKTKLKKDYSLIRVFNAASGFSPVTLKLVENDKRKKLVSGLTYPKPMMGKSIKSATKNIELYLESAPKPLITKEFRFKPQMVYTIVIFNNGEQLDFKILENKGKSSN